MRVANKDCRRFVEAREEFDGSNIFARIRPNGDYTVFSYGYHFPIYHYDQKNGNWYQNTTRFSASTSRHQSQAKPRNVSEFIQVEVAEMKRIANIKG